MNCICGLPYDSVSTARLYKVKWKYIGRAMNSKRLEGSGHGVLQVLSRHLPEGTE
jgi:hypothetical protein